MLERAEGKSPSFLLVLFFSEAPYRRSEPSPKSDRNSVLYFEDELRQSRRKNYMYFPKETRRQRARSPGVSIMLILMSFHMV